MILSNPHIATEQSWSLDLTRTLAGRVLFITGASRGIGLAIAKRAAQDGAKIVIAAKTETPDPRLPGTIYTAAEEIRQMGAEALPLVVDVRFEDQVERAVETTIKTFGRLDILVNNASAIHLSPTVHTPMKRYDLMHQVNVRGTFLCTQKSLPYLLKSDEPHVLNISPPITLNPKWYAQHVAYTMAKLGMSLCVLGMAEEYREAHIAFNCLWPKTVIATAAVRNLLGGDDMVSHARQPQIMADAAHVLLTQKSTTLRGQYLIDEDLLRRAGIQDFDKYAVDPKSELYPDFFID